eukprot:3752737-Prymnesium_polylepis.2
MVCHIRCAARLERVGGAFEHVRGHLAAPVKTARSTERAPSFFFSKASSSCGAAAPSMSRLSSDTMRATVLAVSTQSGKFAARRALSALAAPSSTSVGTGWRP